jgi:hypothetical protein
VKRWAKDRGVCHSAKGHLHPYAWHLLCIFFLQCLGDEEGKDGLLPVFDQFDWSSSSVGNKKACVSSEKGSSWVPDKDYGGLGAPELLKEFFHFYRHTVDWSKEGVSLHRAARGPLPKRMKTAVILPANVNDSSVYIPEFTFGDPSVALAIEDPWEPTRNLSADLTYFGLCRLKEELCRACNLCAENASLSKFLEPWCPPVAPDDKGMPDDDEGFGSKGTKQCTAESISRGTPAEKAAELNARQPADVDALGAALFAELKARGEAQARKATAQLLKELAAEESPGVREKKAHQLASLLKDEKKLSEMIGNKL